MDCGGSGVLVLRLVEWKWELDCGRAGVHENAAELWG